MIVDNGSDGSHEGQACREVEVQVEGLSEPVIGDRTGKGSKQNKNMADQMVKFI